MFSCLGRIGCLVLLIVGALVAWLTRERWEDRVFGDRGSTEVTWEVIDSTGAARADQELRALQGGGGPAYATLTAAELASLLAARAGNGLPAALDSVEAAIAGDLVRVRARVPLDAIRGLEALGPLRSILGSHERIEFAGTLEVVRSGLGQFRVRSASIADIPLPQGAIPALLQRLDRGERPEGLAPDGIGITIPSYIGDVRVARGVVTVYRATP
jgi:hypothetical protein